MSVHSITNEAAEYPGRSNKRGLDPSLLQAEIDFWRSLIEAQREPSRSRESAERMQQALALAEYRLAALSSNRYTVVS
jgi:hypothetical protein